MRRFAMLLLLLPGGCRCDEEPPPPVTVSLGQHSTTVLEIKQQVSAADRAPGGLLAVGTPTGKVLLVQPGAEPVALSADGKQPAHDRAVVQLRLSRDGKRLLSIGGTSAAAWDTVQRRLIRRIQGPQLVSAGVLLPAGRVAFFGTAQGHVLRWEVDKPRAQGVRNFACGGTRVPPARMGLPEKQRCTYGTYIEPAEGPAACVYPVTHLTQLDDAHLARACRTGEWAVMSLQSRRIGLFYRAGHLRTVTPVAPDLVLFGRADGKLRLYRRGEGAVVRELTPAGPPDAADARGELIALAQGRKLRLWHRASPRALARAALPGRAVWLELAEGKVELLLKDGRLISFPLTAKPRR